MPASAQKIPLFLSYVFFIVAVFSAVYGSYLLWERYRPVNFEELNIVQASSESLAEDGEEEPVSLVFSQAEISVPLVKGEITNNSWEISQDAASFITIPTASGSGTIVYGHNYERIFGNLGKVQVGDVMTMTMSTGEEVQYTVISKTLLYPTEIDKIVPVDSFEVVVYTCVGFLDTKRLVVRARLVS